MKKYIEMTQRYSGEYRYRLRGPDGRIKQECDWTPNLLLDQGLEYVLSKSIQRYMSIGTSAVAPVVTQTDLQGTHLATDNTLSLVVRNDPVGPNWERNQMVEAVFGTGVGTGTINEVVLQDSYDHGTPNEATIRFVLSAPIVKGALDQLTFQHRITFWPFTGDVDSVINIQGVPYNAKMRMFHGVNNGNWMSATRWDAVQNLYSNATIPANMDVTAISGSHVGIANIVNRTYGGTAPNFWTDLEVGWGIDNGNGLNCNMLQLNTYNIQPKIAVQLTKVSDGTGIDKLNTHELRLYFRMYSARYP